MSSVFDDTDDDISLRTRHADTPDYAPDHSSALHDPTHDREVTLNTGTVLALFFALALVCAVFFGFGYSMGRKSTVPAVAADGGSNSADPSVASDAAVAVPAPSYKPAPGSPAIQPVPGYMSQSEANAANEKAASHTPAPAPSRPAETHTEVAAIAPLAPKPAPIVRTPPPSTEPAASPAASAASSASDAGTTYVQIAAVSHQEDADVLLSALKRRGYRVLARNETTDKLIHVQIGPFANRKDAEVTRQKLLADGYNAFLK